MPTSPTPQRTPTHRLPRWRHLGASLLGAIALLLGLSGCDDLRIQELEEGISTEAQVRERFGEPDRIWPQADGARTLEYTRQPAGHRNYMITIDPRGVLSALEQVLAPHHFAKVQPGMTQEQVRRLLGAPAKQMRYALKQETEWDWNWQDGPNQDMLFTVVFDDDGHVRRSHSMQKLPDGR